MTTTTPNTTTGDLTIVRIDLTDDGHVRALIDLLDEYARGHTGTGHGLPDDVIRRLPGALAERPWFIGWLAIADDRPAGVVTCFEGLSTFRAQPLLNIHDIAVSEPYRRRGIGAALLQQVEQEARLRGCCKITLEVLSNNGAAIAAYRHAGFKPYGLNPKMGSALFFEKKFY